MFNQVKPMWKNHNPHCIFSESALFMYFNPDFTIARPTPFYYGDPKPKPPGKYVRNLFLDISLKKIIDYRSVPKVKHERQWNHSFHLRDQQKPDCRCMVYVEEVYLRSLKQYESLVKVD